MVSSLGSCFLLRLGAIRLRRRGAYRLVNTRLQMRHSWRWLRLAYFGCLIGRVPHELAAKSQAQALHGRSGNHRIGSCGLSDYKIALYSAHQSA